MKNPPQIRSLPGLDLAAAFDRLRSLPHRIWLDSASDHAFDRGRYSFLTADPVAWTTRRLDQSDPWPDLASDVEKIAAATPRNEAMPPFCGGIIALIAYEASWWLEPVLRHPDDSLAMAWGVYDWVIAVDHAMDQSWLLSTGIDGEGVCDSDRAIRRAELVWQHLQSPPVTSGVDRRPEVPDPAIQSNFSEQEFESSVAEIVARIGRGDSFQVNLAQHLAHPATCDAATLYHHLRHRNRAPYAAFMDLGEEQILSSSPEGFLQVRDRQVVTCPIKGTVPATGNEAVDREHAATLLASEKDRAENIMIVDLMRNDLSRVCRDDSVLVPKLCEIQRFQRVQHLVSTVTGTLREGVTIAELLAACFPGGSITGAPKVEAMKTIRELERRNRGAYCGSLGYISTTGDADFNILIRTITQRNGVWEFPVGGGITARSVPPRELAETWVKAQGMIDAIAAARHP